jgi:hypothetical protein
MATAIRSGVMTESPGDPYAWPTFEGVEKVPEARCTAGAARHAAEHVAAAAVLKVRRNPLRAVGVAIIAGAVAGSLMGFGLGWFARK